MHTLHRLLGGLLAAALLTMTGPARAADVDPLLPDDSEAIFTVNFRQMLDSALMKKLALGQIKAILATSEDAQKWQKVSGIDPLKDLTSLTIAGPGGKDSDNKGLVILRGNFDPEKVAAAAEEAVKEFGDTVKVTEAKDGTGATLKLYQIMVPENPEPMFMAVAGKSAVVLGPSKQYILDAVEKAAGRKQGSLKSAALKGLIEKLDGTLSIGVAAVGSAMLEGLAEAAPDAKEVLAKVDVMTGGIKMTDGIGAEFNVVAKDEDGAKAIAKTLGEGLDQANLLLGFMAMNQKELAPFVEVLQKVKPASTGKTVTLKGDVSAAMIDKALQRDQ